MLTLTAISGQTPTDADFQAALSTVTYTDTSDSPSTAVRTVTFTVQDPNETANGGPDTATATTTIHVPQNLVVNGGFETGNLLGWTTNGYQPFLDYVTTNNPHSGNYDLTIGAIGSDFILHQNISTVPGEIYQIVFWLNDIGGTPSDLSASFGGSTLMSLVNTTAQPYTEYTFNIEATASSTELLFAGRQDPSFWYLDAISVVDTGTHSAIPAGVAGSLINLALANP